MPRNSKWGLCEYIIGHTKWPPSPVILWIELDGKPKWLPLNFGYHDVMRTCPSPIGSLASLGSFWQSVTYFTVPHCAIIVEKFPVHFNVPLDDYSTEPGCTFLKPLADFKNSNRWISAQHIFKKRVLGMSGFFFFSPFNPSLVFSTLTVVAVLYFLNQKKRL